MGGLLLFTSIRIYNNFKMLSCEASVAQLVEQLICNQWAGGSSPFAGSIFKNGFRSVHSVRIECINVKGWGSRAAKGNRL